MFGEKSWDRPWSTDEIIENSQNWNLAGDVALLNTLKSFSENIVKQTTAINNNLNKLTNELNETSLKLNIARNEFQSLRNVQFIESRVYEDDESLVEEKKDENTNKGTQDHTDDIRLAALKGLEVLDDFFEKVEVSISDSDEEDCNLPNFVLRPKDQYIDRPLPYIIGSTEWHNNWHVGLEDSSSDSETEKVSENFSESDSEEEVNLHIPQDQNSIKPTSETSSELEFEKKSQSNEVILPQVPTQFASELVKKLDDVISETEVNTRPIQPQRNDFRDIFFDEPPPLEEARGPLASSGGLFDDEYEELGKGGLFDSDEEVEEKKKPVGGVSIFGGNNLFDKKLLKRQESSEDEKVNVKIDKKINLFDSDEEELFVEEVPKVEEKPVKTMSLFDDDDDPFKDDLFSSTTTKKFTSNLFDDIPDDDNLFESKSDIFDSESANVTQIPNDDNLFESKNDIFDSEIANVTQIPDDDNNIFDSKPANVTRIPDDDNLLESKNDIFDNEVANVTQIPDDDNIFESKSDSKSPNVTLFETKRDDFSEIPEVNSINADQSNYRNLFDSTPPPIDNQWEPDVPKIDIFSNEPPSLEPEIKSKPGKLKHNVKINVGALLPGSLPPKRIEGAVTQSFDETDRVEVLHSVTKDRVKVPFNRRPSTRRGRREALKKSSGDFKLEKEVGNTEEAVKTDSLLDVKSEPFEDNDLFKKSTESSLFGDLAVTEEKKGAGLFDDDDDDLFSSKKTVSSIKTKKSLFDDDDNDEDDDIFKSFTTVSAKKNESKSATEKKIPKLTKKKLENTKPEDDPLSALLK